MKRLPFLKHFPRLGRGQQIALWLLGGVVMGLGGLFLYLLRFHTYLGDDPSACVNCHIMSPYYATWMHGSHARNTTCNDCHVPHDNVVRKYFFKAKDGSNHVFKFVTRTERHAMQAIDASATVIMENCNRCHGTLNQEAVQTGRIAYKDVKCGEGKACWDCHREVAHGRMNSLASTPHAQVPLPASPVPEWLQKLMRMD
ncbi:MAG: cytochrome c nitrite reductase small subunit [Bacteroidaceae bacterium]|nr:cytochrome c nitrite reductase small subunit [Bacteroidaceae bacterium]